jgi:hypothetical protein
MMEWIRWDRLHYSCLFLAHSKFSILNTQCSIFKGERELRLAGLRRIIEEKEYHRLLTHLP